jgi:hypothetical protein
MLNSSDNSGFTKAVVVVFFLIWTLASAAIAAASLGMTRMVPSQFGLFSLVPWFFAIIPLGFTLIGVMMIFRVITARPSTPPAGQVSVPPSLPSVAPVPTRSACPGCGSRQNAPGTTTCAHCGGVLPS